MSTTVSAIMVIYNSGAGVLDVLHQLAQLQDKVLNQIIVVDNQSTDDIPNQIAERFPAVLLIRSAENRGFGAGNNAGAAQATGDYLALINPDLTVAAEDLKQMVAYLDVHPNVGIVGPRTVDPDGRVAMTARPAYTVSRITAKYWHLDKFFPRLVYGRYRAVNTSASVAQDAAWLQGSCLVLRRDLFEQVGGFDEGFFLYAEDTDLCERVGHLGKRVVYLPQASAEHIGGGTTSRFPLIRIRHYHRSPLYYFSKRRQPGAVRILKAVFIVELLLKSGLRRVRNIGRHDEYRAKQASAEWQVLWEVLRYKS